MTIFRHAITWFPEWVAGYLLHGKLHYDSAELENLSDRSLEDIGQVPLHRVQGARFRRARRRDYGPWRVCAGELPGLCAGAPC